MKTIFITATGTGIGKTLVTTALCYQLQQKGYRVRGIKPIISGWSCDEGSDTVQLLQSLSLPVNDVAIEQTSPWRFAAPLSPDMAAAHEGKLLPLTPIVEFCLSPGLNHEVDYLIIEGAGGVMTPINPQQTMLDLMDKVSATVILVTGSYLGSLSHTLTALEVIKARNLPIHSIIVSETEKSTVSLEDTKRSLQPFTPAAVITVPRIVPSRQPWTLVTEIQAG